MEDPLDKLTIRGFKSIRQLEDFEFKNLNVVDWRQWRRKKQSHFLFPHAASDHQREPG